MAKKLGKNTSRDSKANSEVRPFGADYVMSEKRNYVDLKAHPNVVPKHLERDDAESSVRPFGANYVVIEKRDYVDIKSRPDLLRRELGDNSLAPED